MSAIAGLWRFDGRPGVARDLGRMLSALRPYGTDHTATHVDGMIGLGRCLHRSLPEDRFDRQPLQTPDGRLALVADVRLDNRDDLVRALGRPLGQLTERCDADLLLACLDAWGAAAAGRIIGDFAFACWDSRTETLLLARDYRGNRPLFVARADGLAAVASMVKGLHALTDIPYAPDPGHSADFLLVQPGEDTRSFWAGIERVPPGSIMSLTRAGRIVERYWHPARPDRGAPPRDYVEGVRFHLESAVAARLRGAEGKVGAHLSAGFDSAAVATTAARLMAPRGMVTAFTAVPGPDHARVAIRGRIVDEGPLAAQTAAAHANIDHIVIHSGAGSPIATLDRDFHLYEMPLLNRCNMVWSSAIFVEAQRRGIGVMLSGEIGNLTLSYSGEAYLDELIHQWRGLELIRVSAALLSGGGLTPRGLAARVVMPLLPRSVQRAVRRRLGRASDDPRSYAALHPDMLAAHDGQDAAGGGHDGFALRLWALSRHDPGNYYKGYVAGWGIDQRDPTSDRRLAEYMLAAPMHEYVAGGQFRSLARRALADRVPHVVLNEPRKGLQAADWHRGLSAARGDLRAELERIAACDAASTLLDLDRLKQLERDWPDQAWDSAEASLSYRTALLRAVSVGHFLRKASGSNG